MNLFNIPQMVFPPKFRVKDQALLRDNYTCQDCGKKSGKLDVHHIIPKKRGGTDSLRNLVTLCRTCHREEEHRSRFAILECDGCKVMTSGLITRGECNMFFCHICYKLFFKQQSKRLLPVYLGRESQIVNDVINTRSKEPIRCIG